MANWTIDKNFVIGTATVGSDSITVNTLGGAKGDKGDKGDDGYTPIKGVDYFDGEQGIKGDKGDEPTTEELTVLMGTTIDTYVSSIDDAIDIINGQIV